MEENTYKLKRKNEKKKGNKLTLLPAANIRFGDIDSTFGQGSGGSPTATGGGSTPTSGGTVPHWGQCGGIGYSGPRTCASGYSCVYVNDWYSQCL